ncbi:MAG: citrate lyase subunit alpha, partial [Candidatus Thermoplasmatota archaeon]|nr:citrate lyase subunit alpha [Candidatus Thermoplasmatota archaeon]
VDFNAYVVTHSDGKLLHGICRWQNSMFAQCTFLTIPALRRDTPMIRDRVTTLVWPGDLVDVVVTERGIAINPRRTDLVEATAHSDLPIRPLREIKEEAEDICGCTAPEAELTDRVVAVVEWVDGTVLDSIWQLPED